MSDNKITAIVIDDDYDTVELFQEYLELEGVSVLGKGYDGKDAVELYLKYRPEVVFLDVMMPNFDGIYGLKEIRKINPNAKIIMVTADLTTETANALESLNATVIVYKPYEFDDIMVMLKNIHQSNMERVC